MEIIRAHIAGDGIRAVRSSADFCKVKVMVRNI